MALRRPIVASLAAAFAAAVLAAPAQAATFQNGSFEDIVSNWTADPSLVQTFTEFNHRNEAGEVTYTYLPVDGLLLGVLTAPYEADTPFVISQTFTTVGGLFSGWAAFSGGDALPWNDAAFVRLVGPGGIVNLFTSDIAGVGDYGHTPWNPFSVVLAAGTYTFEAGVSNASDPFDPSFLILDGITLAEVPEPGTWALILTGFFGLGAALRRRRARALNPA